jgi:hypothetical protein
MALPQHVTSVPTSHTIQKRTRTHDAVADSGLRSHSEPAGDRVLPVSIGDVMSRSCQSEDASYDPKLQESLEGNGRNGRLVGSSLFEVCV